MSYAEQIFGAKENRIELWIQDLMLAGTASATFNNSDRMKGIADSVFVKDNGVAGYYLLLWCKRRNIPLTDIFRVGQRVAITNRDYGTMDIYVLVNMNETSAEFVSDGFVAYMPILAGGSTHYDGHLENTLVGAWFRGETPNWYTHINYTGLTTAYTKALNNQYGYKHGLDEEFKDVLNSNENTYKNVVPLICDDPLTVLQRCANLGLSFNGSQTGVHLAKTCELNDSSVGYSSSFWMLMLPEASTENNAIPLGGAFYGYNRFARLNDVNAGTFNETRSMISNVAATKLSDTSNTANVEVPILTSVVGVIGRFYIEF